MFGCQGISSLSPPLGRTPVSRATLHFSAIVLWPQLIALLHHGNPFGRIEREGIGPPFALTSRMIAAKMRICIHGN